MISKFRVDFKPCEAAEFGSGVFIYALTVSSARRRAIKKAKNSFFIPYWEKGYVDIRKIR